MRNEQKKKNAQLFFKQNKTKKKCLDFGRLPVEFLDFSWDSFWRSLLSFMFGPVSTTSRLERKQLFGVVLKVLFAVDCIWLRNGSWSLDWIVPLFLSHCCPVYRVHNYR